MEKHQIYAEPPRRCYSKTPIISSTDPNTIERYLSDESAAFKGFAEKVFFPQDEEDVATILKDANTEKTLVTISGGGTGITGSRVPFGGVVISTEKLTDIFDYGKMEKTVFADEESGLRYTLYFGDDPETNQRYVIAPPGISIQSLKKAVNIKGVEYPPDPTEQSALLGATVATNASGARTFHYGPTRNWIRRVRVVLPNGDVLNVRRGEVFANEKNQFEIILMSGKKVTIDLPFYAMPKTKHSAGYFVEPKMDLIDLFIGSEGTLGVITEVEAKLIDKLGEIISCLAFFPTIYDSLQFVKALRDISRRGSSKYDLIKVLSIEYFDRYSLEFLREKYPTIPLKAKAAVFFEQKISDDLLEQFVNLLEAHNYLDTWAGTSKDVRDKLKEFRHSLPEAVNTLVKRKGVHKMGTDIAVPDETFDEMMDFYFEVGTDVLIERIRKKLQLPLEVNAGKKLSLKDTLRVIEDFVDISKIPEEVWTESGVTSQEYSSALLMDKADILRRHLKVDVPYVIFGHIGDNHLHFNFLPESGRELTEVKIAYMRLARKGVELGGTISGEHGVGKKVYEEGGDKKPYLEVLYGRKGLEEIALLKHKLDPNHILNVGNIVPIKYLNKLN